MYLKMIIINFKLIKKSNDLRKCHSMNKKDLFQIKKIIIIFEEGDDYK